MPFFSARLLYAILVGTRPRRRHLCNETTIVYRARDFDHAFERALTLGRRGEVEYRNDRRERVRWALVEVQTVDQIGHRLDGAEVGSKLGSRVFSRAMSAGTRFYPERSKPGHAAPAGLLTATARVRR
jgi:hypothetical protein